MFERLDHEPLARYTSWKIGGPARVMLQAGSPEALIEALSYAKEQGLAIWLLGGGTNTLALDSGFSGAVVRYRNQHVQLDQQDEQALVRIAAGAPMAGTVRRLAHQGWAGLEWAEGLPGTIGGALYGNAGCYGGDIASSLKRAWLLIDDQIVEWPAEAFAFSYRSSALKTRDQGSGIREQAAIILEAEFQLQRADPRELTELMERTAASRRSKTPAGQSCGSVFKNPPGESAGRLIEAAGLKRKRIGAAEIAEKHANYFINLGGASSNDILGLIDLVRSEVLRQFGIELVPEVQILQ